MVTALVSLMASLLLWRACSLSLHINSTVPWLGNSLAGLASLLCVVMPWVCLALTLYIVGRVAYKIYKLRLGGE